MPRVLVSPWGGGRRQAPPYPPVPGATIHRLLADKRLTMAHDKLRLKLPQGVENHTHDDDQAAAADDIQRVANSRPDPGWMRFITICTIPGRTATNPRKSAPTSVMQSHHPVNELLRPPTGADAGDEPAITLRVLRQVLVLDHDVSVKVRKADHHQEVERPVQDLAAEQRPP